MKSSEVPNEEFVCLVDDDPAILKSIGRLLASNGIDVKTFNDPKNFLVHVGEHRVELVILDIWMNGMNGLEVQAKLSRLSPQTRVILITGRKDPAVEKTARQFGAAAFFTKPFDDVEFLDAVSAALGSPQLRHRPKV
ncbi:MAG TPA: response regulator [Chthoniobacterales bacterium]|jgi:FixJ family two-component response regulator